jgi:hypothetical protein
MSDRVEISTRPVIDFDDQYASASVSANAGNNVVAPATIISFRTKTGKKAFLTKIGNAVQAGGESFITFRLLQNKARIYPYDGSQNQWGDPAWLQPLPYRIELPSNALIEITCDNSDAAIAYIATARVFIEYENY